jgi:hypothetical protein
MTINGLSSMNARIDDYPTFWRQSCHAETAEGTVTKDQRGPLREPSGFL